MPFLNTNLMQVASRVAGLTATIFAEDKLGIIRNVISANDSPEVSAVKMAALLSSSEIISDQLLSRFFGSRPPSLTGDLKNLPLILLSNTVTLYAMDKLNIDEMIVPAGISSEMRAVRLSILFILVQEISTYVLTRMRMIV